MEPRPGIPAEQVASQEDPAPAPETESPLQQSVQATSPADSDRPPRDASSLRTIEDRRTDENLLLLMRIALERAADAVYWVDRDGRFVFVNQRACQWLGYSREELLSLTVPDIDSDHRWASWQEHWNELCQRGSLSFESYHRRKDGSAYAVEMSVSMIDLGDVQYICAFARQIADRIQTESQMRAYTTALEAANRTLEEYSFHALAATRAKSEFLANMSHEIRTPIAAIMGFAEALLDDERDAGVRADAIQTILRNSRYLLELVDDILDLSKVEAGRLDVESISCDPLALVNDVLRLIRPRAVSKGLSLSVHCRGPLPERIRTDPTRLRQVLINILGNAIKFTESGAVQLELGLVEREGHGMLEFRISDTGIGISPAQMTRLFEPFCQADGSTTRRYGGTGLGLAISRRLAELLGGTVTAQSELGRGSCFSVLVATGCLEGVAFVEGRSPVPSDAASVQPAPQIPSLEGSVLLVEDSPDNRRLITRLLAKAGLQTATAADGQEGVRCAMERWESGEPFDLVLMDMQMPVLDGYQATKALRDAGYTGAIVALTANAMEGQRAKCLRAGCTDYLTKPVDRPTLFATIAPYMPAKADGTTRVSLENLGPPANVP